jgi:hypothetical protein
MSENHPKHAAGEHGRPDHKDPHHPSPAEEETAAVVSVDTAGGAMEPSAVPATAQSGKLPGGPDTLVRRIFTGSGVVSVLAVLLALIIGGLLIASTDKQVATTATYFFARPADFLSAVWTAATRSYIALFQGSVFNPRGNSVAAQFAPFMETSPSPPRSSRPGWAWRWHSAQAFSTSARRARSSWPASWPPGWASP